MSFSPSSKRNFIIIGVVSIAFILMPFVFTPSSYNQQDYFSSYRFYRMLSENILLVGFFFLNYFILTSKFYFKKRYISYILLLVVSFIIIYKIPGYVFPIERNTRLLGKFGSRKSLIFLIWMLKALMFLCMALISLFLRQNQRYHEIKEEKQQSEIAYLRAQINPHFLFNTLNNIYSLTLMKSDSASDAVMKLSKMMRFVVSESSKEMVPLQQDLDYIKNYIQLQQLRLLHKNSLIFEINGVTDGLLISPLLLINFIENAFKYGVMDEVDEPIKIIITIEEQWLSLDVVNTIAEDQIPDQIKTEVGIKNTEKRLNYLYANAYHLKIDKQEDKFKVHLKLKLND